MRLLYLSAHSVLEFDEVRLLRGLGHYIFSPGAYVNPENRGDHDLRPNIEGLDYDPEDVRIYHTLAQPGRDNKACLTREFVDRFDAVIVMHMPEWVMGNWEAMSHKRVVLRTIGQLIEHQERQLAPYRAKGLKVVRYSPAERRIPGYMGEDAMVRFYKDPAEYKDWNGNTERVLHVGQDVVKRRDACSFEFYEKVTRPFPRTLIGNGSEVVSFGTGRVPFATMLEAMRDHRCYFYTGTHPASYTLGFIEAWMTGIPVVSIGNIHGNSKHFPGHKLFEVPELLDGHNGFASDDPFALHDMIAELIRNKDAADSMGHLGRQAAIRLFGKDAIKAQWAAFLGGL